MQNVFPLAIAYRVAIHIIMACRLLQVKVAVLVVQDKSE